MSRRAIGWRYGVCVVALLLDICSGALFGSHAQGPVWGRALAVALSAVLGLVCLWSMHFRRRWPFAIACLNAVLPALMGANLLTTDWALMSLATRRRFREVVPVGLICLAAREVGLFNPMVRWLSARTLGTWSVVHLTNLVGTALEVALVSAIGFYVGARRDLVATLRQEVQITERQQELAVLHAEAQERQRIAREMHDVVAHRISLVAMHAGALAYRDDLGPEQTREIAQTIQENAAASLTELRSVLGQLRTPGGVATPGMLDKPQPTVGDIRGLVLDARAAGMVVDYDEQIERPDLLPSQTGRHAYRIVQEALTNARKHANGARVSVQVGGAPGHGLDLLVHNPVRGQSALLPGAGAGLVGMRERTQMVGGQMNAGVQNGDFEVKVWLPW